MKYIKKFNEGFLDFLKSPSKSNSQTKEKKHDYSSINRDDNSLIPFSLFHPTPEVKDIVNQKISNLENDGEFIEIMNMIENGEFKKAKSDTTQNHFNIGKDVKIILSDDRAISVNTVKTWERADGDYDVYYVMSVDGSPLGYISSSNYRNILSKVKNYLNF